MIRSVFSSFLMLALVIGCGGGSSGDSGNGIAAYPSNVGDTRNDGVFEFNNTAPENYSQLDRMGVPVIATVLIRSAEVDGEHQRDRFNESDPANDGDYAADIVPRVDQLHRELDGAICSLNFTPCSRRNDSNGTPGSVCDSPNGDSFSITNCAVQAVPQIVPDVLTYDLDKPDGFPNGRALEDPVVDRVLSTALLDINGGGDCDGQPCSGRSFEDLPLNPRENELPFLEDFPFVALPHAVERERID